MKNKKVHSKPEKKIKAEEFFIVIREIHDEGHTHWLTWAFFALGIVSAIVVFFVWRGL